MSIKYLDEVVYRAIDHDATVHHRNVARGKPIGVVQFEYKYFIADFAAYEEGAFLGQLLGQNQAETQWSAEAESFAQ